MGLIASLLNDCCVRCKSALAIADLDVTQDSHADFAERLANLELLTRRYHLQPGGLLPQSPLSLHRGHTCGEILADAPQHCHDAGIVDLQR